MKEIERLTIDMHDGIKIYLDGDEIDSKGITKMDIHLDVFEKTVTIDSTEMMFLRKKKD